MPAPATGSSRGSRESSIPANPTSSPKPTNQSMPKWDTMEYHYSSPYQYNPTTVPMPPWLPTNPIYPSVPCGTDPGGLEERVRRLECELLNHRNAPSNNFTVIGYPGIEQLLQKHGCKTLAELDGLI